jgi:hypothetical protein
MNLFGFLEELDPALPKKGPGDIPNPTSSQFLFMIGFIVL